MFNFSRLEEVFNNLCMFRAAELTRANTQEHGVTGLLNVYNFE